MRPLAILATTLAIPAVIAVAQTASTTNSGQSGFVALFSSGGLGAAGTNGSGAAGAASGNATWYIDTNRNLIVLCTQNATGTTGTVGGQPAFRCTAQTIQTQETPASTGG